ncbi:MAG: hypothetical protein HYU36_02720 [Planctomycetes bacterium]|nr:hypothetical protein [Planctomycetota bacterium]
MLPTKASRVIALLLQILGLFLAVLFAIPAVGLLFEGEIPAAIFSAALAYGGIVLYRRGKRRVQEADAMLHALPSGLEHQVASITPHQGYVEAAPSDARISEPLVSNQSLTQELDPSPPSCPSGMRMLQFTCKACGAENEIAATGNTLRCEFCDAEAK